MKKKLLLAAIAAVAFSSCSNDDTVSISETGKGIGFGVLNNKIQSRATETTVANIGGFSVYAYAHASGVAADYTTTTPYYKGVAITVDATGGCTYADNTKQKMWPKTEQLDFLAYSPVNTKNIYLMGTVNTDMSEMLEAAQQQDLVVAKKLNESGVGVDNYKTEMKFNHALSQIKFKAVSKYSTVNFKVKSIKITGVALQGGTNLTTWIPTTPVGSSNTGNGLEWVNAGEIGNVIFGAKTDAEINTTAVDLTADNGALMIIPQTLKSGDPVSATNTVTAILADKNHSYIVIEYSATDKDTGAVLVTNGRCAAPVDTDLKAGLRYVYTMTLAGKGDGGTTEDKLYPIDFTCTVEGWVDGPAVGGEI